MIERKVSPEQFDVLQRELLGMEMEGHGPEACVVGACNAAGIEPPRPFEPVAIVVCPVSQTPPTSNAKEDGKS